MTVATTVELVVDASAPIGSIVPVHGVNAGGVDRNYWFDLTGWYRHWRVPTVRLHDAPFNAHDTVDLHFLFPDPSADPDDPANYSFRLTDNYLKTLRATGADLYFRLGESIEHQPQLTWNDPRRWKPETLAQVCANIVRHYNQGWADGHEWGIRYWEFWNEPHGPKNWNSTPGHFFELYRQVAPRLKETDPSIKVGLAGFAPNIADPSSALGADWAAELESAANDQAPIDFVSWHQYSQSWSDITLAATRLRSFLDRIGLGHAESHLGEWGYRPFAGETNIFSAYRDRRYDHVARLTEIMTGPSGLAHTFGGLVALLDAPVDLAHYYTGGTSARWGLFDGNGIVNAHGMAFEIFTEFLRRSGSQPNRLTVVSDNTEVCALAARESDGDRLRVAVASLSDTVDTVELQIQGTPTPWAVDRVSVHDAAAAPAVLPPACASDGGDTRMRVAISGPGMVVLELVPADNGQVGEMTTASSHDLVSGDW